jgi:hypothetical protein
LGARGARRLLWRVEVPSHPESGSCGATACRRNRAASRCCAQEVGGGEDIFAWLGQEARRLAKDYERLPQTAVAMIYWAIMSRIMLRRLVSESG